MPTAHHRALLLDRAADFAETTLGAVRREYPNDLRHPMSGPDDRPLPHEVHPSFYGCYDQDVFHESRSVRERASRARSGKAEEERVPEWYARRRQRRRSGCGGPRAGQ